MCRTSNRRRRRSVGARAAVLAVLAAALACSGCALVAAPALPAHAQHERGEVHMNRRARARLMLQEHTWHRDERGHLVARLRLRNEGQAALPVEMRVAFFREDGTPEREALPIGREELPGSGRLIGLEWTSDTPEADRYEVQIDAKGLLPW